MWGGGIKCQVSLVGISYGSFSKNSQCVARDLVDCRHCDSCRLGARKFYCVHTGGKIPILNQLAAVFVSFIRGTPILVQLYIVYYGVPSLLQAIQIDVSSWDKIIFIYITYGLNTANCFN